MAKIDACFTSKSNEHYTPMEFMAHVYAFLGHVDLDPCSSELETVFAEIHYTQAMDGLSLPWVGKVFCNPPYGRGLMDWATKIKSEYEIGNMQEGLLLVPSRTETQWTKELQDYSRVYLYQRIKFLDCFGVPQDSAPFPSALFYFGKRQEWLKRYWHELGDVNIRYAHTERFNKREYMREYMRRKRAQ